MNLNLLVYSEETYIASMFKHSTLLQKFSIDTVYGKDCLEEMIRSKDIALVVVHVVEDRTDDMCEICERIFEDYQIPFLIIAESITECERLAYLRAGAIDCISEECRMEELTIRIQNVMRVWESVERQLNRPLNQDIIHFSDQLKVNKQYQYVIRGTEQIYLSPIEFRLLCYLMDQQNQIIDSEQLLEVGWGSSTQVGRDELYVYIRSLRKKLDTQGQPSCIRSFYGKGYLFQYPDHNVDDSVQVSQSQVEQELLSLG